MPLMPLLHVLVLLAPIAERRLRYPGKNGDNDLCFIYDYFGLTYANLATI